MIYIIGLGLDDKEITEKGLEYLKKADKAYAEFYTNTQTINIERLEQKTGTKIEKTKRKQIEQKDLIIEEGKNTDLAFLVSGDPLTATTHYDIKKRAENKQIPVKTAHAPSIMTSITETGLNIYKFGRTVTLPKDSKPQSIIKHIQNNQQIGLHTLVLLDINYPADKALNKLEEMDEKILETDHLVLERANNQTQKITLNKKTGFGETPHSIIITGEKSHKEKENLSDLK